LDKTGIQIPYTLGLNRCCSCFKRLSLSLNIYLILRALKNAQLCVPKPFMKAVEKYNRLNATLFGDPQNDSPANRSVNAICVVTLLICLILLPFNIYFGLYTIVKTLLVLIVVLSFLYYLSRFKKRFHLSSILYAFGSYITIIITYFFNGGINGPALLLFFLTFSLLIGFTKKTLHKYWIALHVIIGSGLLVVEYNNPASILETYATDKDRFLDNISSYVVVLLFMYLIIVYLRKAYSTERKLVLKRSVELEESNAQKTKLFSIIAHDLKTPLNGLIGYLELLNNYTIPEEQRKTVERQLLNSTKQTSELLTNLLYWAKAQMEGITPHVMELPLHKTLEAAVHNLKETAASKNVNLRFHIDETINVYADPDMLLLVVRNLIHNAIKFTPTNGSVITSCEMHDNYVRLMIIDNGVGIHEKDRAELFTVKTKSAYGTNKEKGFGLGLLLCKEFTEMQGGTIGYASMENKGSKFYIDLPAAERTPVAPVIERSSLYA
jgi:two-component system sensor histidine kinase/response regulator